MCEDGKNNRKTLVNFSSLAFVWLALGLEACSRDSIVSSHCACTPRYQVIVDGPFSRPVRTGNTSQGYHCMRSLFEWVHLVSFGGVQALQCLSLGHSAASHAQTEFGSNQTVHHVVCDDSFFSFMFPCAQGYVLEKKEKIGE